MVEAAARSGDLRRAQSVTPPPNRGLARSPAEEQERRPWNFRRAALALRLAAGYGLNEKPAGG